MKCGFSWTAGGRDVVHIFTYWNIQTVTILTRPQSPISFKPFLSRHILQRAILDGPSKPDPPPL